MRPVTRIQKEVAELSKGMAPLSDVRRWEAVTGRGKCFTMRRESWCSVCGHVMKKGMDVCPNCGSRLKRSLRPCRRKCEDRFYYTVVTVCKGWQVLRNFSVHRETKKGMERTKEDLMRDVLCREAFQVWMNGKGEKVVVGHTTYSMSYYVDLWNFGSPFEVRRWRSSKYEASGDLAKWPRLIPEVRRNGLERLMDDVDIYTQIWGILTNPRAETLCKAGYDELFKMSLYRREYAVRDHWASVRIAIRNGYKPEDSVMWLDYLGLIKEEGKDMRSPVYVCPEDLRGAHDKAMERRRRKEERERKERERERMIEQERLLDPEGEMNVAYRKRFAGILGVVVEKDGIVLRMLQDIGEFFEEGELMSHCVFTNRYYDEERHPDSVIISASVNGEKTETIEINEKEMKVVQCHGKHNQDSEYHGRILELMNESMGMFVRRRAV